MQIKGGVKTFSDKQKLGKFITSIPDMQEMLMLMEVRQQEGK